MRGIEWREIKGFDGRYFISSTGIIKSVKRKGRKQEKIMKQELMKKGYLRCKLTKNGVQFKIMVHRMVAESFVPNPENKPFVNHINEVKNDNRVENLEWVTAKENCNHGTAIERGVLKRRNRNGAIPVSQISLDGQIIKLWTSATEAQRNGYSQSAISRCIRGIIDSYKGFKWAKIKE